MKYIYRDKQVKNQWQQCSRAKDRKYVLSQCPKIPAAHSDHPHHYKVYSDRAGRIFHNPVNHSTAPYAFSSIYRECPWRNTQLLSRCLKENKIAMSYYFPKLINLNLLSDTEIVTLLPEVFQSLE